MATNPLSPPPPKNPTPRLVSDGRSRFPWPAVGIIAAILMFVAVVVYLPRIPRAKPAPSAAQVPEQPTGSQIQLTNLKIEPAPTGGAIYLTGVLHNQGSSEITGAQVRATFKDKSGQILESQTRAIESVKAPPTSENVANAPIKPNASETFRVYFEHPPVGWDKTLPEVKVTEVTGTPS